MVHDQQAKATPPVSSASRGEGTLVSQTIGAITKHMREHDLGPGDQLPSESSLSREFSVSRVVVREAFRSLAAMRLIDLSTGRRATVAEIDYGSFSPLIEHGVRIERISIQQIYDVRRTIEVRTATLAALHRSEAEAANLLAATKTMREDFDTPQRIMEADLAMHIEIAKAAKNPVFALIMGAFEGVTRQTWPVGWKSRQDIEEQWRMIEIHEEIACAIADGEPDRASRAMAAHFDVSVAALVRAGIA